MKFAFSLVLAAAVFSQDAPSPTQPLRAALGGEAALNSIQRLHIKATFTNQFRHEESTKGEQEWFVVLPERLWSKKFSTGLHTATSGGTPDKPYPVLTAGFQDMSVENFDRTRIEGFVDSTPLSNGELMPKWFKAETRVAMLEAGRYQYARLLIPLLGTVSTATSAYAAPGGFVYQDQDGNTWTLKLDASGLPASMTMDRKVVNKDIRVTRPVDLPSVTFSDYRAVDGKFMWPHKIVMTSNLETQTTWIKSYEVNGKVPKVLIK